MRFEARELKPYSEPVNADELKEGEIYFSIQFADEAMLTPIMETWVFAGRRLDPDVEENLYFQDIESYQQGTSYRSANSEDAIFQVATEQNIKHMFDYEHALNELLKCFLRRQRLSS